MLICSNCTPGAEIVDLPESAAFRIGQIRGVIFQRRKNGNTVQTLTTANAALLATWTALQSATDDTKTQILKTIEEPVITPGEERTYGGGNQTVGGKVKSLGGNPTTFDAKVLDVRQDIVAAIKKMRCEDVSVFLINECKSIIGLTDNPASPTSFKGIPIHALFVSDLKDGDRDNPGHNMLRWRFDENWSDGLTSVTPAFDPIEELNN